ncbi:dimethylmenaquinone methyltransferase [Alkalihalophilus pseudofirmus OF4]|uniref:Putative 4-hydroxy-4-methyl-2-oxoglutarate aldolase n=1 Tax=Alkalihalophilus pseudofirmus (strain ATCC BAA-2126 / JCM 17055 / OF4) TaxID=398511 RepID=D3FQE0_ALKPO|nr:RraA family protein [Alkalihalophilus pseudofirmus]ADC49612.1 dimethylmenaquinone methyltransferase [Alkalihalophilus pseudofirmus OF4]
MNSSQHSDSSQLLSRIKKIGSTVFADVMDNQNTMDYRVKPVNFLEPLVGRVRTVSVPKGDNLLLHHAIYQAEPNDIIIVNGQGFTGAAYLGELMAGAAEALGIKGIIIDGLVRDKRELRQLNIQIYAKGFSPSGPSKEGPGSFDITITCAGTIVSPYDFVIADQDGVVVVPQQNVEEIVKKAEKKLAYELNRLETINIYKKQNKQDKSDIEPKWLQDKLKKLNL